ncbi:hypothetical protein WME94_51875 [Sorangium sp. So ce429]
MRGSVSFYPTGALAPKAGFHAVVGNPPWDKPHSELRHFASSFDLSAAELTTSVELNAFVEKLFVDHPSLSERWARMQAEHATYRGIVTRIVRDAERRTMTSIGAAHVDLFIAFLANAYAQLAEAGYCGMLLSGGLAKNPAAVPVRALWIRDSSAEVCAQYDNAKRLFADLPPIIEFSLLVSRKCPPDPAHEYWIATKQTTFDAVEKKEGWKRVSAEKARFSKLLTFEELVRRESGVKKSLWALATLASSHLLQEVYPSKVECRLVERYLSGDVDPRSSAGRAALAEVGLAPLLEGRSIRQFDSNPIRDHARWDPAPKLAVPLDAIVSAVARLGFYRMAIRRKCGSPKTNTRSVVAALLEPGLACSDSLLVESSPERRPTAHALLTISTLNAFVVDFQVRPNVQVMITQRLLDDCAAPSLSAAAHPLLAHAALRLTCSHEGYAALWQEQLGDAWREPSPKHTWPVLQGDDARWAVRAAIDALVADAYGLSREQYAHVLAGFSHKSYPNAPERCLAAFDELKRTGLDAFVKAHDPYWDVPLVESLPKPVINVAASTIPEVPANGAHDVAAASSTPAERTGQLSLIADRGPLFEVRPAAAPRPTALAASNIGAPPKNPANLAPWLQYTPVDRQVLLLSRIVHAHDKAGQLRTLGNVKAEKLVHLVESHLGIDMERQATKQAAGPADFPRLLRVTHRAKMTNAFTVHIGAGGKGGVWAPGRGMRASFEKSTKAFGELCDSIDRLVGLFVRGTSEQAEISATLYACWNDILAGGSEATDDAIIEAFYKWSAGKAKFPRARLEAALQWMRDHALVPTGAGRPTPASSVAAAPRNKQKARHSTESADANGAAMIERLLRERGMINSRDAQTATGLDAGGVRQLLKQLVEEGKAVVEGEKRGTRYRWVGGSR